MDSAASPDPSTWQRSFAGAEGATLRPFNVQWLDSALQESLLPGTPWEQIEEKVSRGLVQKLRSSQEFKDMEKKQMILQLLGANFVERHFKDEPYVPNILEPPRITMVKRQQIQRSMQKFLKDKLDDIAKFHEYLPSRSYEAADEGQRGLDNRDQLQPVELKVTKEHLKTVYQKGLDRHLVLSGYTADKAASENIPDLSLPSMNSWSGASNLLGQSLCAILQRDPNKLSVICKRLAGKQLPGSLREFLWAEVLLRESNSTVHAEKTTEKSLRKMFAKMVSKGKLELKISKATECPINGLISKAVQEKYENTVCMQQYKGSRYTSQCSEALNVLYSYNRSYEPFLVHWLFPLQVAFHDMDGEPEDHPYELAFYLNLLQSNTFPRWPEIYAIAEQAMARVQSADRDLYQHLQSCSTTNVKVDPKEFMVQLLEDERKKAASLSWATQSMDSASGEPSDSSKTLLANPVVFLRKWVGEGFVSVLDTQAVLYVWDQCFMTDWDRQVLEDVCLALVLLLRKDFMEATDYHQMKQVFLLKPCKLYTADIQGAFRHLRSNGAPFEVPYFDRRRLSTSSPAPPRSPPTPVPMAMPTPQPPPRQQTPQDLKLRPAGLKDIHLKLVINQPDVRRSEDEKSEQLDIIEQLINFQLDRLVVGVSVWYKGSQLQEKICDNVGVMAKAPSLGRENLMDQESYTKEYQVSFSSESLVFNDVNVQTYGDELQSGDTLPLAVISVMYKLPAGEDSFLLGWATLPLYEHQSGSTSPETSGTSYAPFIVQAGKGTVPLLSGDVPEKVTSIASNPEYKMNDHLQEGSAVTMSWFDPANPEMSREPSASPPPEEEESLWVSHDSGMAERSSLWKPEQGFDLYVDRVRFLPDNATIVKVTGRIVNPQNPDVADMLATPVLDSPARCPCFQYRNTTESAEETSLAVLRVYTLDKATKKLVAVGVAISPLYVGEEHELNVGGFQLPLHSGMPSTDTPPGQEAVDKLPLVPAASILIRILPCTKIFIPAPDYPSGYYKNTYQDRPNQSHTNVMEHYRHQENWSETVQDVIQRLQSDEDGATQTSQGEEKTETQPGEEETETPQSKEETHPDEEALTTWLIDRLDASKHLPEGATTPNDLDLTRAVNYDLTKGLCVTVRMTPGIKGAGLYSQAVCQVLPGRKAAATDITPEGHGVVDRFHTKQHKFSSLQVAPQWKDPPKLIHPQYDPQSYLLIRVIGLTLLYVPDPNQEEPGVIKGKHGKKRVQLGPESYLGWTILPLFDKGSVAQGIYILPLFQDDKELEFLDDVSKADNLLSWLKKNCKKNIVKVHRQYATAVVSIYDGHFAKAETVPLPKRDTFLDVDDFQKFAEAAQLAHQGPKMCQHILRALPKEVQEDEMDSLLYQQEEKYFEQMALIVFDEVLENVKEIGMK